MVKGINGLIEEYKYHREHNYWDLPLDLVRSNGEMKLDVFYEEETKESIVHNTDVGDNLPEFI